MSVGGTSAAPSTATSVDRSRLYLVTLALLPWVFVAYDDAWLYSPPGSIDPWLYHGFLRNYPAYVTSLFQDTYYGTRLGWILPGHLAYTLFPPVAANLVLHLSLFYAAVGATYSAGRRLFGDAVGFLAAVAVGANATMLVALGWDYVDGAVITYSLWAVAFAVRAAIAPRDVPWLLASGAATACAVHSNLMSVLIAPIGPLAFLVLRTPKPAPAARSLAWLAAGALLATSVLGCVNLAVGGQFAFFMPSIRWALASGGPTHFSNPFHFPSVLRLLVPALGIVAAAAARAGGRLARSESAAFLVLGWMILAMGAFDLKGNALFATQFYANWVVPFSLLVIIPLCIGRNPGPAQVWTSAAMLVAAGLAGATSIAPGAMPFGQERTALGAPAWAAIAAITMALTVYVVRARSRRIATVWMIAFCAAGATAAHSMTFRPDPRGKELFRSVSQVLEAVKTTTPAERPLFWFGPGPIADHFHSVASTHLYLYSTLGMDYPELPDDILAGGRFGTTLRPPARVVVLSMSPVDEGHVQQAFTRHGLNARVGSFLKLHNDGHDWFITPVDVTGR